MVLSWQLMLGLYVVSAHSIPDWNVDTKNTDMVSSEWVPGNGITNSARTALANSDGSNEFTQTPGGSNVVSSEIPIAQGRSRCAFDTKRLPRRMRARGGESCAADLLQLNNGEEKGRQLLLPVEPNAQQGGGGQNNDGSGYPDRRVILPSTDDIVQDLFIPKENRPKPNSELCPDPLHPVPVCGKPSDAYLSIYPVPGRLTVDPCYLYVPVVGCLTLEGGRIGYCCLTAPVAYGFQDLSRPQIDDWRVLLASEGDIMWKIEQKLRSGVPAPFKLVGLDCVPMVSASREGQSTTPF